MHVPCMLTCNSPTKIGFILINATHRHMHFINNKKHIMCIDPHDVFSQAPHTLSLPPFSHFSCSSYFHFHSPSLSIYISNRFGIQYVAAKNALCSNSRKEFFFLVCQLNRNQWTRMVSTIALMNMNRWLIFILLQCLSYWTDQWNARRFQIVRKHPPSKTCYRIDFIHVQRLFSLSSNEHGRE